MYAHCEGGVGSPLGLRLGSDHPLQHHTSNLGLGLGLGLNALIYTLLGLGLGLMNKHCDGQLFP